jgi:AP-1 complex subunit gamma-1
MSSFIRLIATSPSEQIYCVRELHSALLTARDGNTNAKDGVEIESDSMPSPAFTEGLTLAGAWVLGEYGHKLLDTGTHGYEIVELLENILESPYNSQIMNEYLTNALMKLSTRLPAVEQQYNNAVKIAQILQAHTSSLDIEIQQRSTEYTNMFKQPEEVRIGVFETMPPPEMRQEKTVLGVAPAPKPKRAAKKGQEDALLELLVGDGDTSTVPLTNPGGKSLDLLNDLLGMDAPSAPSPQQQQPTTNVANILGLYDSSNPGAGSMSVPPGGAEGNTAALLNVLGSGGGAAPLQHQPVTPSFIVYSKNGLEIILQLQRVPDGTVYIRARLSNSSLADALEEILLQAAAPRGQKLELKEISSTTIPPAGAAQLQMRLLENKGVRFTHSLFIISF